MKPSDRTMPANIDAEKAILGSILLDSRTPNECLLQATMQLKHGDFSLDSHRRIYKAMLELGEREKPIDFVTVPQQVGDVASIGGESYITSLTDGLPRLKNIESYCAIVIRASQQRQLIHAAQAATQEALEQSDPGEVTGRLQAHLDSITSREQSRNCVHVSQIGPEMCRRLIAEHDAPGTTIGLPTGIGRLDYALGGLVRGENIVVAGYTGGGKTAFALNIVEHNCPNDIPVTFYSFEMDREALLLRLAAKRRGIPQIKVRTKSISRDELMVLMEEIVEIQRWPLWIDDRTRMTPRELYASARMQAARGARLFVTDHLHIFVDSCAGHTLREQVNTASATIRAMAKDSNVPVLNLCQLSRPEDKRTPQKPTMYHLKESGSLEQDAHNVILLWREKDDDLAENGGYTGNDAIILGKNRSGPTLEIAARYDGPLMAWQERSSYAPPIDTKEMAAGRFV